MGASERAPARTFEELLVWQKAHVFVLKVYKLTELFSETGTVRPHYSIPPPFPFRQTLPRDSKSRGLLISHDFSISRRGRLRSAGIT